MISSPTRTCCTMFPQFYKVMTFTLHKHVVYAIKARIKVDKQNVH